MQAPDRYTCEDVFRRLDDFVDRELSDAEMERVREHLELCAQCAAERRFEESVLRQLRRKLRRISMPPDLLAKIRDRIDGDRGRPADDDPS